MNFHVYDRRFRLGRVRGCIAGNDCLILLTPHGLPDLEVSSILQDREGNLWFGTHRGGVSRYDGQNWTTFTKKDGLGDKRLYSIHKDREGTRLCGTEGGASR